MRRRETVDKIFRGGVYSKRKKVFAQSAEAKEKTA